MARALTHYGGFLAAGFAATLVDLAILNLLMLAGISPFLGRFVSISVAMVVSWWINRTITFAVEAPPTLSEFGKFAAVSWTAQAVNYAVFAIALIVVPWIGPSLAVIVGGVVSVAVSYAGFRFGVFRKPTST